MIEELLIVEDELASTQSVGGPPKFYVTADGVYQGSVSSPPGDWTFYDVPADWIEVPDGPPYADQPWLFPGWGPSPSLMIQTEDLWRVAELVVIADQLLALEEAESSIENGEPVPEDLLPGTRSQWLSFRTKVRAWKVGAVNFPNSAFRPVRPV